MTKLRTRLLAGLLAGLLSSTGGWTQSILPLAETQFLDANGAPVGAGTVGFYIPGTLTPKTIWRDQALSVTQVNPVPLDLGGRALIWGVGSYRQILKNVNGVVIWDQVTASPSQAIAAITSGTISGVTISNSQIDGASLNAGSIPLGSIAPIPPGSILSNILTQTEVPGANSLSQVLDTVSKATGAILVRTATQWFPIVPPACPVLTCMVLTQGGTNSPYWGTIFPDPTGKNGGALAVAPAGTTTLPGIIWGPGVNAKASWDSTTGIANGFNVASVAKTGTGEYAINFINSFPQGNYVVSASPENGNIAFPVVGGKGTTNLQLFWYDSTGALVDVSRFSFAIIGGQL